MRHCSPPPLSVQAASVKIYKISKLGSTRTHTLELNFNQNERKQKEREQWKVCESERGKKRKNKSTWFEFTPADRGGLHIQAGHSRQWWFAWCAGLESHRSRRSVESGELVVREKKLRLWANDSWLSELHAVPPLWLSAGLSGESVCSQSTSGGGNRVLSMLTLTSSLGFYSVIRTTTQQAWSFVIPTLDFWIILINTCYLSQSSLQGAKIPFFPSVINKAELTETSCW